MIPLISSISFFVYKRQVVLMLAPLLKPYCKDQHDQSIATQRSNKIALSFAKAVYYTIATAWSYQLLADTEFLPPMLGGSGKLENIFLNVPY